MFACFFETTFPNILFLKPKLLYFFAFFSFFLVFVVMFYVSAFLFYMCLVLGMIFFVFVFVMFLMLLLDSENIAFKILFYKELCWLEGTLSFHAL